MNKSYAVYILIICIAFVQCRKTTIQKTIQTKKLTKNFELRSISDSTILLDALVNKKHSFYTNYALEFYKKRNYEYAWFSKEGMESRVDMFLNLINSGDQKIEFSSDSLIANYAIIREESNLASAQQKLSDLELKLTYTFFEFADKEWSGSDEKLVKKLEWYIPKKKIRYETILDSLINENPANVTTFKAPMYSQYGLLKEKLELYKTIEEKGGWRPIITPIKSFKIGDTSSIISQIKKRLYITYDFKHLDTSTYFDKNLESGVKEYQHRYGMVEDGKVGLDVLKEMNVPIHQRIEQIIVNLERCRWVPYDLKGNYLIINIPEFKLHTFENNVNIWDMNVVVGKATHKTVIFNGSIKYIVFNPYWVVTPNIFEKEFIPKLRKDPGYLNKQNIELVKANEPNVLLDPYKINWNNNSQSYHSYVAKQKPGPNNSLGKVKFIFPNQYNIYLHDTPAKELFSESSRSFSHGCIRLAEPEKMAKYLLKNQTGWNDVYFDKTYNTSKENYVQLTKNMPVIIAYFTAWVDKEGKLNFRKDIYGHDAKMAKLIIEKPRI